MEPKSYFMICPVREITDNEHSFLTAYMQGLKSNGVRIHFPPEDTDQNDSNGLYICRQNRRAIVDAEAVMMYYNPTSTGSRFDVGMTLMSGRPLDIINPGGLSQFCDDFADLLDAYSKGHYESSQLLKETLKTKQEIELADVVEYEFKGLDADFLLHFGMAFMAEKPIRLLNRDRVKPTSHKSFQNVLLTLDTIYR